VNAASVEVPELDLEPKPSASSAKKSPAPPGNEWEGGEVDQTEEETDEVEQAVDREDPVGDTPDVEIGADAPPAPSELAGMRVALNIYRKHLCVLAALETPYGSIPIACHFGVDGSEGDRTIDLHKPQTPSVIEALTKAERTLDVLAKKETADLAVEDLVKRARLGDQNAMAMISEVKRCAGEGVPRATLMFKKIGAFLKANPYNGSSVGSQPAALLPKTSTRAAYMLANGPLLSQAKLTEIANSLGTNARAFLFGCAYYCKPAHIAGALAKHPEAETALRTGAAVGFARAIQKVRLPNSKISEFSRAVAWELGE
jgi:hypothetical protein